jgi:hypothetical protein
MRILKLIKSFLFAYATRAGNGFDYVGIILIPSLSLVNITTWISSFRNLICDLFSDKNCTGLVLIAEVVSGVIVYYT